MILALSMSPHVAHQGTFSWVRADSASPSDTQESCASERTPAPMNAFESAFTQQITKGYQVDTWFQNPTCGFCIQQQAFGGTAIVFPDFSDLSATLLH